jgi:hypothetical protein
MEPKRRPATYTIDGDTINQVALGALIVMTDAAREEARIALMYGREADPTELNPWFHVVALLHQRERRHGKWKLTSIYNDGGGIQLTV